MVDAVKYWSQNGFRPPTCPRKAVGMAPFDCQHGINVQSRYPLTPGGFLLGSTVAKVSIPHDCRIAARVEGKSSLARIGLGVHITAPTIHAGFGAGAGTPIL